MHVEADRSRPAAGRTGRLPGSPLTRTAAVVAVAAVTGAVAVGVHGTSGSDSPRATETPKAARAPATGVSLRELSAFAATLGHPLYWAGTDGAKRYELTKTNAGRAYVRYLPAGAQVGDAQASFRTVGTYPQANAFATLQATAKAQGVPTVAVAGGGLAFQDARRPTSVYLAYPGSDFQIEVYDSTPTQALQLVRSGRIDAVPVTTGSRAPATAASVAQLRALEGEVGHPVYWLGADSASTYELTRTTSGGTYVRYLAQGVAVGDSRPAFVTVGTYPQEDALLTLKSAAAASGSATFSVAGGGRAYVDPSRPTSVYAAFPGADVHVEVFAPTAARARTLVASGRLVPAR